MLQMIGYDCLQPRMVPNLQGAIAETTGEGIRMLNGPWLVDTQRPPRKILDDLRRHLAKHHQEDYKVFIAEVHEGEIGQGRVKRQAKKEPTLNTARGRQVMAVAYTVRQGSATPQARREANARRARLREVLGSFVDHCRPIESLWLVATDESVTDLHLQIAAAAGLEPEDELTVAKVSTDARGVYVIAPAAKEDFGAWLEEHGVCLPVM